MIERAQGIDKRRGGGSCTRSNSGSGCSSSSSSSSIAALFRCRRLWGSLPRLLLLRALEEVEHFLVALHDLVALLHDAKDLQRLVRVHGIEDPFAELVDRDAAAVVVVQQLKQLNHVLHARNLLELRRECWRRIDDLI